MIADATKPVLLCIIDGLTWRVVEPALQEGELPFLAELAAIGSLQSCVSIFPSITPAATASLVTGVGPADHGIQGALWFDTARGEVEYFGDAPRVIAREGLDDFFDDYLRTLNDDLLQVETTFELAQARGLATAGINLMWRRGETRHEVATPSLVKWLPGIELADTIVGPDWLFLGDFVASRLAGIEPSATPGGIANRFGFNDVSTLIRLGDVLSSEVSPDLTIAYFPDNDFRSHQTGPAEALPGLIELDRRLLGIAERQGGLAAWLEKTSIVVVGDHGHDDLVSDRAERLIDLVDVLDGWRLTPPGSLWRADDELLVCPNMRAAQITVAPDAEATSRDVIRALLADQRIDQIIRTAGDNAIAVETTDRGSVAFGPLTDAGVTPTAARPLRDSRGRGWWIEGDLTAVGAKIVGQDRLEYGEYPDALQRIWSGPPRRQDVVWATARPGFEFSLNGTTTHKAGSHGSLHRSDSETVLITAGLPAEARPPVDASITDIAGMCLASLGVEPNHTKRTPNLGGTECNLPQ